MREWEICQRLLQPGVREDREELERLLDEGWEPYCAAVAGQLGHVHYLRRRTCGERNND